MNFALFARLLKVDEVKRQVTGVIADETKDAAGEIFDYEKSKPHFVAWSDTVQKASGGKSVGNVRGQHGAVAAGRLLELTCDDAQKSISVVADIVDDNEWTKVLKGVYTGFSIGGAYGSKWDDAVLKGKRYEAKPTEVSLVDLGCNPNATFEVVKSDGSTELRKYATPAPAAAKPTQPLQMTKAQIDELKAERDKLDKVAQKPLYDYMTEVLAAADAEVAPAPVVTKECPKREAYAKALAKAATANRVDVVSMLKFMGTQIKEPAEVLAKGLYSVGRLSDALCSLGWISDDAMFEADIEGDGSAVPDMIKGTLRDLGKALVEMVKEEVAEFLTDHGVKKVVALDGLAKDFDLAKAVGDVVQKQLGEFTTDLNKKLETVNDNFKKLNERLGTVEKMAAPAAPRRLVVVEKATEVTLATGEGGDVKPVKDSFGKVDEATTMIKAIQAAGPQPLIHKGLAL